MFVEQSTRITPSMALAGAVAGAAVWGESVATPLFAPIVGLGSAALTAAIAAHAVRRITRSAPGGFHARTLSRVANKARESHRDLLAAKALQLACGVQLRDSSAVTVTVSILAAQSVRDAVGHLAIGWCPPLAGGARALSASKAALRGATFLRAVEQAALEPQVAPGCTPFSTALA